MKVVLLVLWHRRTTRLGVWTEKCECGQKMWVWREGVSVFKNHLECVVYECECARVSVQCWVWQCRIWGMPQGYESEEISFGGHWNCGRSWSLWVEVKRDCQRVGKNRNRNTVSNRSTLVLSHVTAHRLPWRALGQVRYSGSTSQNSRQERLSPTSIIQPSWTGRDLSKGGTAPGWILRRNSRSYIEYTLGGRETETS